MTTAPADAPPINREATGAWRVGRSRVLVEIVIHAFQDGRTPEGIHQSFPSATLAEIYSVIAYYLHHKQEVQDYLDRGEREAAELRKEIEERQGDKFAGLRERLLARRN